MSAEIIQFRPRPRPAYNPANDAFSAFALWWTLIFAAAALVLAPREALDER